MTAAHRPPPSPPAPDRGPLLLLDTCALIWLVEREPMAPAAVEAILSATLENRLLVSPISAWEIGMLSRRKGAPEFSPSPETWFEEALASPGPRLAALTWQAAVLAWRLPDDIHNDPADRLIVSTARELSATIVTRDSKILAYADAGHVRALPC